MGQTAYQNGVDQCSLDQENHELACAGHGTIFLFRVNDGSAPTRMATLVTQHDIHTVAIDPKTGNIWTVWPGEGFTGDFIQRYKIAP